MDIMCSYGLALFDLEDNSTLQLIERLRGFRRYYEPYHGYVCSMVCSFGILTNLINVVVLTKRQMRTSINVLLTGIAFCDMGTMASYLIYILHFALADHQCNPYLYTYGWMFFLMCHVMLSIALHTTTLWLSVAMAFIRNITLRQARIGSPWLRSENTWKLCTLICVCVLSLCIPNVFSNGIIAWPEYFNQSCFGVSDEQIARLALTHNVYTIGVPLENCLVFTVTSWLIGTLFKVLPCILLAVMIISLLCTIRKAEKKRKALLDVNRNRAQQNHRSHQAHGIKSDRTTAMLLMILCLSLLTELPQGAVSILSGIYVAHMQEYVYPNVADILDLLSLINSSVNFILYCIMSSKYRQVFCQVVLPKRLHQRWFPQHRQSQRYKSARTIRRTSAHPTGTPSAVNADSENQLGMTEFKRQNDETTCDPDMDITVTAVHSNHRRQSIKNRASIFSFTEQPSQKHVAQKTISKSALLPRNASMDQSIITNDHFVPAKAPGRRLFGVHMFRNKRDWQWLIHCACLCKCAFKTSVESASADLTSRQQSLDTAVIDELDAGKKVQVLRKDEGIVVDNVYKLINSHADMGKTRVECVI